MPRVFPGNVRVTGGHRCRGTFASWLALIACCGFMLGNPVLAEGDDPVAAQEHEAVATDVPLVLPSEAPSPPTTEPPTFEPTSTPLLPTETPTDAPLPEPPPPTQEITATALPTAWTGDPPVSAAPTETPALIDDALACPTADAVDIEPGMILHNACADPGSAMVDAIDGLPPCTPTVSVSENSLDFGTSLWNGTAYTATAGTLTLTIDATGAACTGLDGDWNIQVSGLPMTRVGGTHIISPASMTYAGLSGGGAPPTGVIPVGGTVTLDGARTIATTTASDTAGGSWSVAFLLSPPADTPPGSYTGTIVIDVTASSSDP